MKSKTLLTAIGGLLLTASCTKQHDQLVPLDTTTREAAVSQSSGAVVVPLGAPVAEAKVYKLLPGYGKSDKFEASGVYYLNGYLYVVCDNLYKIAKVKSTLPVNSSENMLLGSGSGDSGFEAITYNNNVPAHFYVVEEAVQNGSNYQPRIREYDAALSYQNSKWADYYFSSSNSNKGFEGIASVYRGGVEYILGLVEGTGKIAVLQQTSTQWKKVAEITLPSSVSFGDYSDLTVYGNKIAITSQQDSRLWIGSLSDTSWSVSGGTTYSFPTGNDQGVVGPGGKVLYANVEGVSFLSLNRIAVVSDKAKSDQPSYQTYKDQSVHIFDLP